MDDPLNSAQPSANTRVKRDMEAVAALGRDAELMLRVRDGDDTGFAMLLERHRAPVIHFLHRMVQNQAIAEELAQEVFLRVYRSRGRNIEEEMLYEGKLCEVRQAIESLPVKQRAAVLMHKYEELEYSQIAQALGCSGAAVKSLLFRAYESLRARLSHMA